MFPSTDVLLNIFTHTYTYIGRVQKISVAFFFYSQTFKNIKLERTLMIPRLCNVTD